MTEAFLAGLTLHSLRRAAMSPTLAPCATVARICKSDAPVPVPGSALLKHLWEQAVTEWQSIGGPSA